MKIDTNDLRILIDNAFCELTRNVQNMLETHKVYPSEITMPVVEGKHTDLQLTLKLDFTDKMFDI